MRRGSYAAGLALALIAVLFGLCWRLEPHAEQPQVVAVSLGSQDGEDSPVLSIDETAQGGVAFRNQGKSGCRLRVRVCVDQVDGKPVLEAGHAAGEEFLPAGEGEPEGRAYWTAREEYLYYENLDTGGVLLPGEETPPVYTAVRVNRELGEEERERAALLGEEQRVFVVVEAEQE